MPSNGPSPILTVAVDVYGLEDVLERCLRSLADPDGPLPTGDVEVLVVDDGSRDRSAEIAEAFAALRPGIRVIRKENGGQGSALALAIREARGAYFTVVDGDDEAVPDSLRRAAGRLRWLSDAGGPPDVMISDRAYLDEGTGRIRIQRFGDSLPANRNFGWEDVRHLRPLQRFSLNSLVFRRDLLAEACPDLPERTHFTDVLYTSVPLLRTRILHYLPEPLSLYHKGRHGQATSMASTIEHVEDHVRITRLLGAASDALPPGTPPAAARYVRGFFVLMLAASLGLLAMSRRPDRDRQRHGLVRWLKRNHPRLHREAAFRPLVLGARIPGPAGGFLIGIAYRVKLALHLLD